LHSTNDFRLRERAAVVDVHEHEDLARHEEEAARERVALLLGVPRPPPPLRRDLGQADLQGCFDG